MNECKPLVDGLARALAESERAGEGAVHETAGLHEQLASANALTTELERAREQSQRELAGAEAGAYTRPLFSST